MRPEGTPSSLIHPSKGEPRDHPRTRAAGPGPAAQDLDPVDDRHHRADRRPRPAAGRFDGPRRRRATPLLLTPPTERERARTVEVLALSRSVGAVHPAPGQGG